ncbi:hypothetical protein HELRODRAFT_175421 [Helobdella robusta]|uniref:Tetraspanin n=1 Tax=Helobdella robusta TaxID=6412 RepID=T1F990_HELRO|nr:hypothetical protein HELRODRAFT_175421 [Helobdella robusta]ESO00925.1 hypothetical protein HELRODRAFT_175421 [Helobdella robusta]
MYNNNSNYNNYNPMEPVTKRTLTTLNRTGQLITILIFIIAGLLTIFSILSMSYSIVQYTREIYFTSTVFGNNIMADSLIVALTAAAILFLSGIFGMYVIMLGAAFILFLTSLSQSAAFIFWWYCCGVEDESWGVYRSSAWYLNQSGIPEYTKPWVPLSCCVTNQYGRITNSRKCQFFLAGPPSKQSGQFNEAVYYRGCYMAGKRSMGEIGKFIIAFNLVMCLLLIVQMTMTIWFYFTHT